MRAASTVLYHSAILSNWPVRRTKWAYLAGLIGCVAGARWRIGVTSFIGGSPVAERLNTAYTKNFRAGIDFAPDRPRTVDVLPAVLGVEIDHGSTHSDE